MTEIKFIKGEGKGDEEKNSFKSHHVINYRMYVFVCVSQSRECGEKIVSCCLNVRREVYINNPL